MKTVDNYRILSNKPIAHDVYEMMLDCKEMAQNLVAGQFVEIYVGQNEHILPRPLSVCEIDKQAGIISLVYRIVGSGTSYLSLKKANDFVQIIAPLGNGFPMVSNSKNICLVGGGVGTPPLVALSKALQKTIPDASITVYLGFQSQPFLVERFEQAGIPVFVSTDDGSVGFKGNAVSNLAQTGKTFDVFYACGPKPMLVALCEFASKQKTPCYVSLEERMACGVGACLGCAVKIKQGDDFVFKKVCTDGPVFCGSEVDFS